MENFEHPQAEFVSRRAVEEALKDPTLVVFVQAGIQSGQYVVLENDDPRIPEGNR
jgi:hypothetical protein